MSGMSSELTLPSQFVSNKGTTMGAIMTSVPKGEVICPPQAALRTGLKVPVGWYSHCSRQVSAPSASGVPASAAQVGGLGRHFPSRSGAPL